MSSNMKLITCHKYPLEYTWPIAWQNVIVCFLLSNSKQTKPLFCSCLLIHFLPEKCNVKCKNEKKKT